MSNQLSNVEKAMCARIGISEAEYLAQKRRNATAPMTV
jgi:hypothetical protein